MILPGFGPFFWLGFCRSRHLKCLVEKHLAMIKTPVGEVVLGIILPSYIGILISHYKDPHWLLVSTHLKNMLVINWINSPIFVVKIKNI